MLPAAVDVKLNVALVWLVGLAGCAVIVVSGAVVLALGQVPLPASAKLFPAMGTNCQS